MPRETPLLNEILVTVSRLPGVRAWRANAGTAWVRVGGGNMRPIQVNVPGCPDIIGWMTVNGLAVFLGIEVKTAGVAMRETQESFQKALTSYGGIYIIARSVDDAVNGIAEARRHAA